MRLRIKLDVVPREFVRPFSAFLCLSVFRKNSRNFVTQAVMLHTIPPETGRDELRRARLRRFAFVFRF